MCIGDAQYIIRTLEVGWDLILIAEVIMVTTHEVIRGMWEIIIIEGMIIGTDYTIEIGVGHLKDRIEVGEMTEVWVIVGMRSGSRASTNRDRIRCFECREYDHFLRECPTRQESRETEQIQQMFNMGKDQTILQTPLMDTEEDKMTITLMDTRDNLNL